LRRRGFIGALLAVVAAPKALFEKASSWVSGPVETSTTFTCKLPKGMFMLRKNMLITFVDEDGEPLRTRVIH